MAEVVCYLCCRTVSINLANISTPVVASTVLGAGRTVGFTSIFSDPVTSVAYHYFWIQNSEASNDIHPRITIAFFRSSVLQNPASGGGKILVLHTVLAARISPKTTNAATITHKTQPAQYRYPQQLKLMPQSKSQVLSPDLMHLERRRDTNIQALVLIVVIS